MNNLFLEEFYEEINTNDYFDTVFTESVFNPMGKWIKKLKEIKNTKPDEFSDDIEIKQFVDKQYDDIIKSSKLLEKDVSNLTKKEILYMVTFVCGYLGGFLIMVTPEFLGLGGIVGAILSFALVIISIILEFVNHYSDNRCAKELRKIKSSLIKVQNKKGLDENTKKKISRMITSIKDAEAEYTSRIKVEESAVVYDRIFEALQEKIDSGLITVEDAETVNDLAYAKYMGEPKDDDEVSEENKKALKKKIAKTIALASTAIATVVILKKICKKLNNKKMEKEISESQEKIKKLVPELKKYLNKDSININEYHEAEKINKNITDRKSVV